MLDFNFITIPCFLNLSFGIQAPWRYLSFDANTPFASASEKLPDFGLKRLSATSSYSSAQPIKRLYHCA